MEAENLLCNVLKGKTFQEQSILEYGDVVTTEGINDDCCKHVYLGSFNLNTHLVADMNLTYWGHVILRCIISDNIISIAKYNGSSRQMLICCENSERVISQMKHTKPMSKFMETEKRLKHLKEIPKGIYGDFSKIKEEFLELEDSVEQKDKVLQICELSDLIGAIEGFSMKKFNLSIEDLHKFANKIKETK